MLSVALRTLRSRWTAFAGTFVALALGVAMSAAMGLVLAATFDTALEHGPQRYVRAPIVVRAGQTLTVSTGKGKADSRPLGDPKGVSAELITNVSAVGTAIPDRSFYVYLAGGGPSRVGHPWSAAGFGPYRLTAGHAPRDSSQIVVGGGGVRPGDRVTVLTADRGPPEVVRRRGRDRAGRLRTRDLLHRRRGGHALAAGGRAGRGRIARRGTQGRR